MPGPATSDRPPVRRTLPPRPSPSRVLPPRPSSGRPLAEDRRTRSAATGATPIRTNATIVEREDISPTIIRLRVRPDDGVPPFRPGQYFALGVEAGDRPLQRPYSTASASNEADSLEFLIRLVPHGALTPRLWTLHAGARLRIGRPKGLFTIDPSDRRRPLLIATGTGIAPLLAMLESHLASDEADGSDDRPIVLHGVAHAGDLAYRARFEALHRDGGIRYVPAVSRPGDPRNGDWQGATGRVHALLPGLLDDHRADPSSVVAYVCGNPGMTEAVTTTLRDYGLPADAIRSEAYWVPAAPG